MIDEITQANAQSENDSTRHIVHVLMQFALAVRHRKHVVLIALVVSSLLCGLHYATADRQYMATAGLVLKVGNSARTATVVSSENLGQSNLPTYLGLISRSEVVRGAIDRVPREHQVDFAGAPPDARVNILQSKLSISNPRLTNIVDVSYRSADPHAAVTVVNAVVDSYQEFMDATYKGAARKLLEQYERQRNEKRIELDRKEMELLQAREKARNLVISAKSDVPHPVQQRFLALSERWNKSKSECLDLETRLILIQQAVERGDDLRQHIPVMIGVVDPEFLRERLDFGGPAPTLRNALMQELIDEKSQLAELQRHLGGANPRVLALREKIRETEQAILGSQDPINQQAARIRDGQLGPMLIEIVRQKLNVARQLQDAIAQDLILAEERAVSYTSQLAALERLEHDRDLLRDDVDSLTKRIGNVNADDEGQEVRVHIVDRPKVNENAVSPKLANTVFLALVLGLGLGLSGVYVLDILDDRFRSMEEMQALLRVPVLALIRELELHDGVGIDALQTYVKPNATESEAFRTLRTALSLADHDTRQVVVSSPEPGDGKTTVLANLAVAVAQSGKRTLLIDADLRRPGMSNMLGMRGIGGLSTVIRGDDDIVEMTKAHLRPSGLEGLDVLPCGPRPTNPAELLGSQRFSELLAWAESAYDQVFIDSPPTLATSDTAVIGRLTNGVVLVVQPAKNHRRVVMRCVDSLAVLNIPLLGVVVNRVGAEKDHGYYRYGGYYGYEYDYGQDQEEDRGDGEAGRDGGHAPAVDGWASTSPTNEFLRRDEAHPPAGIVPRGSGRHRGVRDVDL